MLIGIAMDDVRGDALPLAFLEPVPLVIAIGFIDPELSFHDISVFAALLPMKPLLGGIRELSIGVPIADFLRNVGVLPKSLASA